MLTGLKPNLYNGCLFINFLNVFFIYYCIHRKRILGNVLVIFPLKENTFRSCVYCSYRHEDF